jgi:hypothetical protein
MKRGYDNFTMVDSQLATRRRKGTDFFYMNPPVNFNTTPGASSPVVDPNASSSGGGGISADQAVGIANTAGQLLLIAQNRRAQVDAAKSDLEKNIEGACGKQPVGCAWDILNLRPDCKAHKQCRADYVANVQALERAAVEAEAAAAAANRSLAGEQGEGLSTGAIIGIVVGGVAVLGTILFLTLRKK